MRPKIFLHLILPLLIQWIWMANVGYVLPYVPHFFLIPFLVYSYRMGTGRLLLLAFGMGLTMDYFTGTGGLYAASLLSFAALKRIWKQRFARDTTEFGGQVPSLGKMSLSWMLQIIVFEIIFYFFDGLSFLYLIRGAGRILAHAFFSWIFIWLYLGLTMDSKSSGHA